MNSAPRLNSFPGQISARSAEIEGQVVTVSPLIGGCVERVLVVENQLVEKDDLLIELDHRELDRKIAASSAELDDVLLALLREQMATYASWRLEVAAASLEGVRTSAQAQRARNRFLLACQRRLHAEVQAPVDGRVVWIARRPRELVGIAQPLLSILQSDDLWTVASFDKDVLERIRAGQHASVHAAGAVFPARVDSIDHEAGQALLEFFDSAVEPAAVLRPGAPAAVIVDTQPPRNAAA
jgi:multidrug resistance efflux pump